MTGQKPAPILLVSASPRRRRLLRWLGVPFDVASVETAEDLDSPAATPEELAAVLAAEKAMEARARGVGGDALLLAFDTIVVLDGIVLGKPVDTEDAWRMLRTLSGRTHEVVTGFALLAPDLDEPITAAVTTNVQMKALSDADIESWMASGEFMGCAGAYNIEGQVADVTASECYQNVAGLPLCHLFSALLSNAPDGLAEALVPPISTCDATLGRRCQLGPKIVGVP